MVRLKTFDWSAPVAFIDEEENKFIVRIVYDGPARAGKTTNLVALCKVFSTARRSELLSPEQTAGRTTYFDWLQVDSGVVGGSGLRSIFLTVPGQRVLARRRFTLIELADVVAFVVDASEPLDEAAHMFRILRIRLEGVEPRPAIVVQLNKHELSNAHSPDEVRRVLQLEPSIPVVVASAAEGNGVRETAVLAMRAGADRVQTFLRERGKESMGRERYDAEALKELIDKSELGREYAPVAALQQSDQRGDQGPGAVPAPFDAQSPAQDPATENVTAPTEMPSPSAPTHYQVGSSRPPLPSPEVSSGCIWPAAGRDVLRRVQHEAAVFRSDLCSNTGTGDGSGGTDTVIVQAGNYCLKTSRRRFSTELDVAKARLLSLARSKVMLKDLVPEQTVISLQESNQGGYYIWTTTPWLPTLRHLMQTAIDAEDEDALGLALQRYAQASLIGAELAARSGVILDVHPSNFALQGDKIVYVDDDVGVGTTMPTFGYSLLRRVEEYAVHTKSVDRYLSNLEVSFHEALNAEERRALDLAALVRDTLVRSEAAERAKQRLVLAFSS